MRSKIYIKYMSEDTVETLKANLDTYTEKFISNPTDSSWINGITRDKTYITKKYSIKDFDLKRMQDINDKKTEIENSIKLYEHLKDLPDYVLADEKFWSWINFEKGYEIALKMIPVTLNSSVIKNHWLFSQGARRSLFFGVFSRTYLRVAQTVDKKRKDPYELSRFAIEKPDRFRNLSWRAYSSQKHIVRGVLTAEKKIYDKYGDIEKSKYFTEIAKYVSKLGSVMLLDVMSEDVICNFVYDEYKSLFEKDMKEQTEENLRTV